MKQELRLINTTQDFKALQHDWNMLYEKSKRSSIFSSWDWMFTWWEVFSDQYNRELFIICLYQNEELVGIAPFQLVSSFPRSLIQGRTLCFIGSGESQDDLIVSQFIDFIVLPGIEDLMVKKVSEYLLESKRKWDFADFEFLLEDALIMRCFSSNNSKVSQKLVQYGARYYVSDVASFDDFQGQLGNRWKKMLTKKSRLLSRDGEVRIDSTDTTESIEPALEQLADMHRARWQKRIGRSVFSSTRFYRFHHKILHQLQAKNKASIKTLYLNDEALASYYSFTDKEQVHYYQSGFYSKNANRYSPLFILVCNEIASAIENEQIFDFMFSEELNSYKKQQYAAKSKAMYRLRWSPVPLRFLIFDCAKFLRTKFFEIKEKVKKKQSPQIHT